MILQPRMSCLLEWDCGGGGSILLFSVYGDLMGSNNWYKLDNLNIMTRLIMKNPAYGRHRISRRMRIVGQIQLLRGCMIYLKKKEKKRERLCDFYQKIKQK